MLSTEESKKDGVEADITKEAYLKLNEFICKLIKTWTKNI